MLNRPFSIVGAPDLRIPSGASYYFFMHDYRELCQVELVALELREALYAFARHVNVNHFGRYYLDGDYTHAPGDLAEGLTICRWLQGGAPDDVLDAINVSKSYEPATLFRHSRSGVAYAR